MSRPELTGHAATYYNEKEARKYNSSSRMIGIQREITERAIELLRLPNCNKSHSQDGTDDNNNNVPSFVLDIGCGSGLSGQVLEEYGHVWLGCDISRDMLFVAKERMQNQSNSKKNSKRRRNSSSNDKMDTDQDSENSDSEDDDDDDDNDDNSDDDSGSAENDDDNIAGSSGDLMQHDMGTGLPFRPATFDACISISALQWLCYSTSKSQIPKRRLLRFFSSLYVVLKRTGRAVLQFYPETAEQAVLISETATSCGFTGGVVVDYPNSAKAKKHYLVLSFDRTHAQKKGIIDAQPQQQVSSLTVSTSTNNNHKLKKENNKPIRKKKGMKTKEWILHKKEVDRKRGKQVRPDSKYTARKRPTRF
jgi:18S rRNA (guanine1575-N7)-methyltransferase